MNTLLKALLKEVMDLVTAGKAAVGKQYAAAFAALVTAGEDVPPIVQNWADLKPELQALLSNPASDADLLAHASSLVGGESPAVAAVVSASADFVLSVGEKGYALYQAIEAAKAAPAATAPAAS